MKSRQKHLHYMQWHNVVEIIIKEKKYEQKVALLCDSSADISEAEAKELGIYVLRMPVIVDGKEYVEGIDIFDEDIFAALQAQKKITTTQPSMGKWYVNGMNYYRTTIKFCIFLFLKH